MDLFSVVVSIEIKNNWDNQKQANDLKEIKNFNELL